MADDLGECFHSYAGDLANMSFLCLSRKCAEGQWRLMINGGMRGVFYAPGLAFPDLRRQ